MGDLAPEMPVPEGRGWLIAPPPMELEARSPPKYPRPEGAVLNRPNDHTPEIFKDAHGQEYISRIYDADRGHGIYLERLNWEKRTWDV